MHKQIVGVNAETVTDVSSTDYPSHFSGVSRFSEPKTPSQRVYKFQSLLCDSQDVLYSFLMK
jgi:hypothetical protein